MEITYFVDMLNKKYINMKSHYVLFMVTVLCLISLNITAKNPEVKTDTTVSTSRQIDEFNLMKKELELKYESAKKSGEIELLNLELKRARIINYCILLVSFFFCISWLVFMIKFYKLKKLNEMMK